MNRIVEIPGFKEVVISKIEQLEECIVLHVSMPLKELAYPNWHRYTKRVHDYRVHKIKHLKWFERLAIIFY